MIVKCYVNKEYWGFGVYQSGRVKGVYKKHRLEGRSDQEDCLTALEKSAGLLVQSVKHNDRFTVSIEVPTLLSVIKGVSRTKRVDRLQVKRVLSLIENVDSVVEITTGVDCYTLDKAWIDSGVTSGWGDIVSLQEWLEGFDE